MIMSPMMTEFQLWLVMNLTRQKRKLSLRKTSRIFNPEPVDKDKWEPHEAIVNYVNQHFSKMFSNSVKSVIKDEVGFQI